MCLEAVKPRSFILAQFSEADRALVYVVRGPVSSGGVGFGGTSKLGRIKRPPGPSGKEEKDFRRAICSADLKRRDRVLVSPNMIAHCTRA
jgi:hypothetical protein